MKVFTQGSISIICLKNVYNMLPSIFSGFQKLMGGSDMNTSKAMKNMKLTECHNYVTC